MDFSHSQTTDSYGGYFSIFGYGTKTNFGLSGQSYGSSTIASNNTLSAVGVKGYASISSNKKGYGYGIYGTVSANKGAGVCGQTIYSNDTTIVDSKYAGLFIGNTKVVGNLTVTGSMRGILLGEAVPESGEQLQPLSSERSTSGATEQGTVNDKLSQLSAMSYYHQPTNIVTTSERLVSDIPAPKGDEVNDIAQLDESKLEYEEVEEVDVIGEQLQQKKHYTLDVDQLEDIFPELVYQDEKGLRHINYMEMIPLLIESINELNKKIESLEGNRQTKKAPAANHINKVEKQEAHLFQNTPNPFTERTDIRFSLPDNAANAAICIFDMSGKMLRQIPVNSGMQSVTINGYELAAGMYLYSLVVGGQEIDTKRMILSK